MKILIQSNLKNKFDKVTKQPEKDVQDELSPMDPPDGYLPPSIESVPYEEMHVFLQKLIDEHKDISKELNNFEEILLSIQENGIEKETNSKLRDFFQFIDNNSIPHHQKEEKVLFPLLAERLIEKGEHSQGPSPTTAVDMLEDDHIKSMQLAATVFNLFALSGRLPDHDSRLVVLDIALEQGKALVELLRLHIFREDSIVFPIAHKHISKHEFDAMEEKG
jgi:hemerythrin-like domain-containing protein